MSPRFVLGRENVPCAAEVVNRSLKADCTDFTRSDSESIFQQQLVNTMDMIAAIQYILTEAQSLGSQVYYKKSQMTIRRLAGVLFCKNEQA